LENPCPAADHVGNSVANVIADILAPAIASKDSAEKITNSTDNAAHRAADGLHYIIADVLENRGKDIDEFLDELANRNQYPFDYSDGDLDQLDNWLKHQFAKHTKLPLAPRAEEVK
jgi:hypothetical protein